MAPEDTIWVVRLLPRLAEALEPLRLLGVECRVRRGVRLPFACEITEYEENRPKRQIMPAYLTDIVVADVRARERWAPRVAVECRARAIPSHAVLHYDMKAAAHKAVHPYMRSGLLLAKQEGQRLPPQVIRHGTRLDFIISWRGLEPAEEEFALLVEILKEEVEASRRLEVFIKGRRDANAPACAVMRRRLEFL
jgi:hypothetical protein